MVHEVICDREGSQEFSDHTLGPHEHRGRAVTEPHFIKIGGFGLTLVGGGNKDLVSHPTADALKGRDQRAGATSEGVGKIFCKDIIFQVQRGFYNTCTQSVSKWQRGGAEVVAIDKGFVHTF